MKPRSIWVFVGGAVIFANSKPFRDGLIRMIGETTGATPELQTFRMNPRTANAGSLMLNWPAGHVFKNLTLMGITALWTAAKYRLPVLIVVGNNRSYFNDELHQESVARRRGRNEANAWVGQRLDDPAPDIAGLARAQGVAASGPVSTPDELLAAVEEGVAALRDGRPYLIDVLIDPRQGRETAVKRATG